MIRMILIFLIVYALFHTGIHTFRNMSDSDKWSLTKTVVYSIICASLTVLTLTTFVILF